MELTFEGAGGMKVDRRMEASVRDRASLTNNDVLKVERDEVTVEVVAVSVELGLRGSLVFPP